MIAFAYARAAPTLSAMYETLSEGLVANLRNVFPEEEIAMITDNDTPIIKGINKVLRIERTQPLMVWRLKCHQMAHTMADKIMFVEPDVRFMDNVLREFTDDFDIAITTREDKLKIERKNTKYTLGMTFSRSAEFWREAKIFCQSLDEKDQAWFGDLQSVAHVIDGGAFKVKVLEGSIYNHVVNDPSMLTDAKVLHYKGKRKQWLFPQVTEAA